MALTKDEIVFELRPFEADVAPLPYFERVKFQDAFEELSFGRCRRSHAEDALKHPRAAREYSTGGVRVVLATKVVAPSDGEPFVLLVLAVERDRHGLECVAGFRLTSDVQEIADDPTLAFATFLDRYGLRFTSAGVGMKFSTVLLAPRGPNGEIDLMSGARQGERGAFNLLVKPAPDHVELSWPFAINGDTYLADVGAE